MSVRFSLDSDGRLLGPHGTRVTDVDIPAQLLDDDNPLPDDAPLDADDPVWLSKWDAIVAVLLRRS